MWRRASHCDFMDHAAAGMALCDPTGTWLTERVTTAELVCHTRTHGDFQHWCVTPATTGEDNSDHQRAERCPPAEKGDRLMMSELSSPVCACVTCQCWQSPCVRVWHTSSAVATRSVNQIPVGLQSGIPAAAWPIKSQWFARVAPLLMFLVKLEKWLRKSTAGNLF